MNSIPVLPNSPGLQEQNLSDLFSHDECDFCGDSLTTENELLNGICLVCTMKEEHEAKLNCFNDLANACRCILCLRDIIENDIRPEY